MTKVINITDLKPEPAVALVIDGVRHEMKAPTVADFVANFELIEKLGVNASPKDEMLAMVEIVTRAFPTLTRDQVLAWPLENIQQISEIARGGEVEKTDEVAAEGNAPKAS